MKIQISQKNTPCRLVNDYWRFRRKSCLVTKASWKDVLIVIYPMTDTESFSETLLLDWATQNPPPPKKKRELQRHEVCRNIVKVIVKNKTFFGREKLSKTFNLNAAIYRWRTKCLTINCVHNTFLLLQKHLTSGTKLILIGWKIVRNEEHIQCDHRFASQPLANEPLHSSQLFDTSL